MKTTKKILAMLLAICMLFGCIPATAFASETTACEEQASNSETEILPPEEAEDQPVVLLESNGTCGDNVYWELSDDGVLTISGSGPMKDYTSSLYVPWYSISSSIQRVVIEDGITYIGNYVFYNCTAMTSVTIPDSVTSIGGYAFYGCRLLASVTIPDSVTTINECAFSYCTALTEVTVPDSVTTMSYSVFSWCTNLTKATLGRGITSISDDTFGCCKALVSVTIPDSVTSIGDWAFGECYALTEVTIPDGVTSIDIWAFYMCRSLTEVTIPASVTSIGVVAFNGCSSLTGIRVDKNNPKYSNDSYGVLFNKDKTELVCAPGGYQGRYDVPETVTAVSSYAFSRCSGINEISFPGNAPSIGSYAFENVTATVYYPANDDSWVDVVKKKYGGKITWDAVGEQADDGTIDSGSCGKNVLWRLRNDGLLTIYGTGNMADYDSWEGKKAPWYGSRDLITSVVIEEGVTSIGDEAFYRCESLASITIPASVTSIGLSAFVSCYSLADVTIPDGVESIFEFAFARCNSLTEVTIPASVSYISQQAFYGCEDLTGIYVDENNAFYSSDSHGVLFNKNKTALLQVPCGYQGDYSIPGKVKSIGDFAFASCLFIDEIYFSGNAPTIASDAFEDVTATAYYPADNGTWTSNVMQDYGGTITWVPYEPEDGGDDDGNSCGDNATWTISNDGVLTISGTGDMTDYDIGSEDYAPWYDSRSSVRSVVIEDGVTSIGNSAFAYCEALTEVTIPESVTSIGRYAFETCSSLSSLILPSGLRSIELSAFGSTALTSITIPESVTFIDGWAFAGCQALTDVVIRADIDSVSGYLFYNCSSLNSVQIPDGVTSIEYAAFYDSGLRSVTLPESVTFIDQFAFGYCGNLTEIVIPENVETICYAAFAGCGLTSLKILGSNAVIESYAFYDCAALSEIYFGADAPQINSDAFYAVKANAYYPADNATWTDEVMQDYGGALTWVPYGAEETGVQIVTQPENYVGLVGDMASFSVEAEGEGLTYRWEFSQDNGTTWEKASSTTNTLSFEFKAYRLNYLYRCVITDAEGNSITTDIVELVADEVDLVILTQPESFVGAVNDNVAFTVEATGNGLTYEWFFSTDGGETWAKSYSPGYATNTLAPILRAHRDGNMYKCVVTDVLGNSVESDVVSMSVETDEIIIVTQPVSVENAVLSQLYGYSVVAEGVNLTYRWQVSTDGGETWEDSWNQGYNTPNLSVRMNANRNGNMYRCAITSGQKFTVYTDAVVLDMQAPSVNLVSQSGNVSVTANETATFTVEAEGTDLTYLWYRSDDKGATWYQTYLSGYNTNTLSFTANVNRAALYMCKITDGSGKVIWSSPVKLQILSNELKILTQPVSVTCANNETVTFRVEAQGVNLKYQWYYSIDGENWTATYLGGYDTNALSFVAISARAQKVYMCMITDAAGNTVQTDTVSVTIA